ncbi:MAG TPA: hypothetical protein QF700_05900, partial [Prochlorococcus sp.]|nr:hypothetical protein [Prochlorococcus sp.]
AEISVVTIPEFTADLIIDIVNETIADSVPSFSPNTPLIVTDFEVGNNGDSLNFDDLLNNLAIDYDGSNAFSNGYISLMQNGDDTIVSFDIDGIGGDVSSVVLSTLQNVDMILFDNNNVDSDVDIQVVIPTSEHAQIEVLETDPIINQMVEEIAISTVGFDVGPVTDDLDPITNQVVVSTETSTFTDATDPITNPTVELTATSVESSSQTTLIENPLTASTTFEEGVVTVIEASPEVEAVMAGSVSALEPSSSTLNPIVDSGAVMTFEQLSGGATDEILA